MDLFNLVFDALSPYAFAIAKLAFATTLFGAGIKMIRSKVGSGAGMSNPYSGVITPFLGYLFCRGIPIIIKVVDNICTDILSKM